MEKLSAKEKKIVNTLVDDMTKEHKNFDKSKIGVKEVVKVMEVAEKFSKVSGMDKKNLVVYIIEDVVMKSIGIEVDMEFIKDTIDVIIDVSRGKFKLNKFIF